MKKTFSYSLAFVVLLAALPAVARYRPANFDQLPELPAPDAQGVATLASGDYRATKSMDYVSTQADVSGLKIGDNGVVTIWFARDVRLTAKGSKRGAGIEVPSTATLILRCVDDEGTARVEATGGDGGNGGSGANGGDVNENGAGQAGAGGAGGAGGGAGGAGIGGLGGTGGAGGSPSGGSGAKGGSGGSCGTIYVYDGVTVSASVGASGAGGSGGDGGATSMMLLYASGGGGGGGGGAPSSSAAIGGGAGGGGGGGAGCDGRLDGSAFPLGGGGGQTGGNNGQPGQSRFSVITYSGNNGGDVGDGGTGGWLAAADFNAVNGGAFSDGAGSGGGKAPQQGIRVALSNLGNSSGCDTYTLACNDRLCPTPVKVPVSDGYEFLGYYLDGDASGTQVIDAQGIVVNTSLAGRQTLVAHWKTPWEKLVEQLQAGGTVKLTCDYVQTGPGATITRDVTLDLNGHRLRFQSGQRLADVTAGTLTVESSSADGGVLVGADGAAAQDGGGLVVRAGGTFRLKGGVVREFKTDSDHRGGFAFVEQGGTFELVAGSITGCSSGKGGGIAGDGVVRLSGGGISNCTASAEGGGVWLSGSGRYEMTGGTVRGCTEKTPGGVASTVSQDPSGSGGSLARVSVTGGVLDAEPVSNSGAKIQWAGTGYEPLGLNGCWTAVAAGSATTNELGQIVCGTFAFDPSAVQYDGCFPLAAGSFVIRTEADPVTYAVWATEMQFGGYAFNSAYRNGVAVITNVTRVVGNEAGDEITISIPATIANYPVGIGENAFAAFASEDLCLNFLGAPPTVVGSGALPDQVRVYYPRDLRDAWRSAGEVKTEDGLEYLEWNGVTVRPNPYVYGWGELVSALADSGVEAVGLGCAITQDNAAAPLSVGRSFAIDLNGHDLVASNRLAIVNEGGALKLSDSLPAKGAAIRGGCSSGQGGLVRVDEGGRIEAHDVTFADAYVGPDGYSSFSDCCGGAVALVGVERPDGIGDNGVRGVFTNCRFVNCRAPRDAGALYLRHGRVSLDACTFVGNRAGYGGAINTGVSKSELILRSCVLANNASQQEGGAIYGADYGSFVLNDCIITNNTMEASGRSAVFVRRGVHCTVTNTLVVGNLSAGSPGAIIVYGDGGSMSFTGGVLDSKPVHDNGRDFTWAAAGFAPFTAGGIWSVAVDGTLATNELGQIKAGRFAFDPSAPQYDGWFPLASGSIVVPAGTDPAMYVVRPSAVEIDGYVFEYESRKDVAVIANVTRAVSEEIGDETVISIPATIANLPVGLAKDAFAAFASEDLCLNFLGAPPTVLEAGAIPSSAFVCYPRSEAAAWEAAGVVREAEGQKYLEWQGLFAMESPYVRSWDELAAAAADPAVDYVELLASVVQPAGGEALTVTNDLAIGLNGHDLVASNRLAVVSGGSLSLYDQDGSAAVVSGGCPAGEGGLIRVGAGGSVEARNVTFSGAFVGTEDFGEQTRNCGGAVAVTAVDASGLFENCRFVGCRAQRDGGAVFLRSGRLELVNCTLVGNLAAYGGAVNAGAPGGTLTLASCLLTGNGATAESAAVHGADGGSIVLTDCVVTNNVTGEALLADADVGRAHVGCVYVGWDAICSVTNTLFADNRATRSGRFVSVATHETGGRVAFTGGVTDAKPVRRTGEDFIWAADGYETCEQGGRWTAAASGTFGLNCNGQIWRGTFAFDPSASRYAPYLRLDPAARVAERTTEPKTYVVSVFNGGPYRTVLNGVTYTYVVQNGEAVLDAAGGAAAVSPADGDVVIIPADLDGFPLNGIRSSALSGLSDTCFLFLGAPPRNVATNALPATGYVRYRQTMEESWAGFLPGETWNGLMVLVTCTLGWEDVRTLLEAGKDVRLGRDVTVTEGGAVIRGAEKKPRLFLFGHAIAVPPSVGTVLTVTDGASLELMDGGDVLSAGQTGKVSGGGGVRTSELPVFDVVGGTLRVLGGDLEAFNGVRPLVHVGAGGVFELNGGSIRDCVARDGGTPGSGFLVDLDGGSFAFRSGSIRQNRSEIADVPAISVRQSGSATLYGGGILANALGASGRLLELDATGVALCRGTVFKGNTSGGAAATVDCPGAGERLAVSGGVFDKGPAAAFVAWGYELVTFTSGDKTYGVVAQEDTVATANGRLTAGWFTFDPKAGDLSALGLLDDETSVSAETVGTASLWRLTTKGVVACESVESLRANLLAGNKVRLVLDEEIEDPCKMPSGFVYRAAVLDESGQAVTTAEPLKVTLKLYAAETGGTPLWSGVTNVMTKSEGVFQIWVSDAMRTGGSETSLAAAFAGGAGVYLGVAFGDEGECTPRRNLVSSPLVNRARVAAALDPIACADRLYAPTGTVTCAELNLGNGGVCATLEIAATNAAYNVRLMDVGGFTLYRHPDNRILAPQDGEWKTVEVKTGDRIFGPDEKSCLLTLQSTEDDTVPMLVVPIPAGGTFDWQSTPFKGRFRITRFGAP